MQIKYYDNLSSKEHIPPVFWVVSSLMIGMFITAISFINVPIFLRQENAVMYGCGVTVYVVNMVAAFLLYYPAYLITYIPMATYLAKCGDLLARTDLSRNFTKCTIIHIVHIHLHTLDIYENSTIKY